MHLLLDGRAFSLQQKGGVSQLWSRLFSSRCFHERFCLSVFLYPGHEKNIHLLESKILNNNLISKIHCGIPPTDNFNFADTKSIELRRSLIDKHIQGNPPDIVLNSYYGENIFADCKRYMVVVHDFAHEDLSMLRDKLTTKAVINRKVESVESASDLVYISGFTRRRAHDLYPQLKNTRNRIIYHGHDQLSMRPTKVKGQFVHIGTRSGYKNFELVAKVFTKVLKHDSSISLVLVGGEPADTLVNDLICAYPDQVSFCTDVSDEIVLSNLASSEFFISASYYEGFGIPVLNSLHTGTHLILSDIPAYKEIASHFGYYFDPSDHQQLENHVTSVAHSLELIEPSSNRSWERVSADYANFILNEVLP